MPKSSCDNIKRKQDWMGSIPARWEILKIRELFTERKEKVSDKEYEPLSVSRGGVVPQISTVAKSNGGDNRKLVRQGDFVINSRSDRKGSSGLSTYNGSVSLINIVLCPRTSINEHYTHYLLKSHSFIEEYYRNGRGIVDDLWTTRYSEMKSIVLPVPPRSEQDQIVRYLDWQVSKTNKLISALRKQIALLKEQKQAIINEAVTKGLDPGVPMKDSGVEWIEETPDGWDVMPLKRLFVFGKGLPIKKTDLKEDGASVISYGQVHSKTNSGVGINYTLIRYVDPGYLETNPQSLVEKGDFIFADTSEDFAGVGNCVFVDNSGKLFAGYHTIILHASETEFSEYMAYLFLTDSWRSQLRSRVNGVKVYSVTKSILNQCTVLIPPLQIQKMITNYLKAQCGNIDSLVERINKEISLLGEYRTRLISDVVTGQIDVRDAVVPEFEYVSDETSDISDDEGTDAEEPEGEEA